VRTLILLDTGPLGLVTHPKGGRDAAGCQQWLEAVLDAGALVRIPAISDYELRRELLRSRKTTGLDRLDQLVAALGYLPLGQDAMMTAAEIWAAARGEGKPTAPDAAIDGDCLLAAQARTASNQVFTREEVIRGISVLVATTNVKHLDRFANARHWSEIHAEEVGGSSKE